MSAKKPWTLGEELAELERTNPAVRAAKENLDKVIDQIIHGETLEQRWARINARRQMRGLPPIGPIVRRQRAANASPPSADH